MKYKKTFYPKMVVPAIPYNKGIRFLMESDQIDIDGEHADNIWKIIANANGFNDINTIASETQLPVDYVEAVMSPGDWKKFTEEAKDLVNMIYEKAPEEIKQIIKKVLWALLKQMNVPNEEARELMGEIGGRGMGILFEHAEKMDIQAERRNTAREKERADAEKKRADAEKRRADEAETELAELRQKLAKLEAQK